MGKPDIIISDDMSDIGISIASIVEPLIDVGDKHYLDLDSIKVYLLFASRTMFARFGIEEFNVDDQCKFVQDLVEYFQEQRDVTVSPSFSKCKPDNKISQYISSSSESNKISLFTKVLNATSEGRPIVFWSLSHTLTCDPITGKKSHLLIRI